MQSWEISETSGNIPHFALLSEKLFYKHFVTFILHKQNSADEFSRVRFLPEERSRLLRFRSLLSCCREDLLLEQWGLVPAKVLWWFQNVLEAVQRRLVVERENRFLKDGNQTSSIHWRSSKDLASCFRNSKGSSSCSHSKMGSQNCSHNNMGFLSHLHSTSAVSHRWHIARQLPKSS